MAKVGSTGGSGLHAAIGRRKLFKTAAVAATAGAAGAFATPALAAVVGPRLRSFNGRYAIRGGRIIEGYFVAPAGRSGFDVVVVMPAEGMQPRDARALADQHASAGRLAIVPDLDATYRDDPTVSGYRAKVAAMVANTANLKRLAHGNGTVAFVSAG